MSLKAYQKAQVAVENPRATEYRLFGQITGALMDAKSAGAKGTPLVDVIDRNRRLWSMLAGDCMSAGNQLPKELRAQIVSLAIWVSKYSTDVMQQDAPLDPLIDVNRTIMQGLQASP